MTNENLEEITKAQFIDVLNKILSKKTTKALNEIKNEIKKESKIMMNRKEQRIETLRKAGVNTNNFFNLSMNIPVGSNVQIVIDGIPYEFNSSNDPIVQSILEDGYVYNPKTDGRWVAANTFKMLNERSYNWGKHGCEYEYGWDAYLRNRYGYMYQFEMMVDEIHRLAKMEKDNDPDFNKLNRFFTKEVVYQTCKHYIKQLKKYIKTLPVHKCKGEPYVTVGKYRHVFVKDLDTKVYASLEYWLNTIAKADTYAKTESYLRCFVKYAEKVALPFDTPKCSTWKDAYKANGSFKTLMNIIKHHNVVVENYETGEILDRDGSVKYVEALLDTYVGQYWKYHELLKAAIKMNNFDLSKSIEEQKN